MLLFCMILLVFIDINLLLTELEIVAVRTERSEVRTKTTEGQYSPVRLEQARLESSLLYGIVFLGEETLPVISFKSISGVMSVDLMTRATQKQVEQFITRVLKHFVSQREPFSTFQSLCPSEC